MQNRRKFFKNLSTMPLLGGMFAGRGVAATAARRDFFKELNVRPFINAAGTYTVLTASLMPPEVVQAIDYASRQFVGLNEMHDATAKKIASLIGCEAAMITAGAASALTVGTAACITGKNQAFIQRLPDIAGMKNEVIVQKSHRYGYDHAVRNCGVKLVEIETAEELERAVNDKTAMMLFFNANDPVGKINSGEFVRLGKKHNIPTFNDAAADTPPVENISKYSKMGFDLVTFSGGKGIRGPQSCGLLLGRKDLIEAARLNASPFSDSIGRGMKVNKEEMLGMMVAVELFMKRDHDAEWKDWEKSVRILADSVGGIKTVSTDTWIPPIANHVPHLKLKWDQSAVKISPADVVKQLRDGDPSIEVTPGFTEELVIAVWMLQRGEVQVVARRVREILKAAAA